MMNLSHIKRQIIFLLLIIFSISSSVGAHVAHSMDTLDAASPSHRERLDFLLSSEDHTGVLHLLDSLRGNGIYNRQLSWQYVMSLYQLGRLDAARDSLRFWEEDSLLRTHAENMLVQIATQQRDHLAAIKYLIRLRDRYPGNPVYPHRLARAFVASNFFLAAEGQYSLAYKLDTLNQVVIGEWADILQRLGFAARANGVLQRGIAVSPENLGFRRQIVSVAYELGKFKDVVNHGKFLTEHGDTTAQTVKTKAFALFQLGNVEMAEYWLDYLFEKELYGEDIYFYKGKILVANGDKMAAQEYFNLAVSSCLSPNFNSFGLQAGINFYETRQYADAIRMFQLMRSFSQNPMITFYLASTYFEYYEDREPAYRQYLLFLEQSTSEEEETHRQYARARIREINEERHFRGE